MSGVCPVRFVKCVGFYWYFRSCATLWHNIHVRTRDTVLAFLCFRGICFPSSICCLFEESQDSIAYGSYEAATPVRRRVLGYFAAHFAPQLNALREVNHGS